MFVTEKYIYRIKSSKIKKTNWGKSSLLKILDGTFVFLTDVLLVPPEKIILLFLRTTTSTKIEGSEYPKKI